MQDEIEIRLKGAGIRPGLVRSHELAELLEAIEDVVSAEAARLFPEAKREDIVVGLYEIADRSLGLRFKASLATVTIPAFVAASQAVAAGDYLALSPHSLKPLQVIAGFAKRRGAIAEFKLADEPIPLATIGPETIIPEQARISGLTEFTAKTLRVGGKVPRAMLEMLDGTVIYCELHEGIAVELGHHLYKLSTFSGTATWNVPTLELDDFKVEAFRPFLDRDAVETLAELRTYIGATIDSLGDVNELAARLRRDEDQE